MNFPLVVFDLLVIETQENRYSYNFFFQIIADHYLLILCEPYKIESQISVNGFIRSLERGRKKFEEEITGGIEVLLLSSTQKSNVVMIVGLLC